MILVVTHSQDLTADFVIRHLNADGRAFRRLDTDRLGRPDYHFGFDEAPYLEIPSGALHASEVGAVWYRRFANPLALEQVAPEHREFVKRELSTAMDAFFETIPSERAINTAEADRLSGNRLLQAGRARKIGLQVPRSFVTQQIEAARAFVAAHPRVVTKAISYGRVSSTAADGDLFAHTSEVTADTELVGVTDCPALFQEMIDKRYEWRATSVGNRLFAARIDAAKQADATDWRQRRDAMKAFEQATLPPPVADRILALSAASGIVYGAHDLIETPEGEFVFLETNPAGQWGWLEVTLGLPVGRAIADELAKRADRSP